MTGIMAWPGPGEAFTTGRFCQLKAEQQVGRQGERSVTQECLAFPQASATFEGFAAAAGFRFDLSLGWGMEFCHELVDVS